MKIRYPEIKCNIWHSVDEKYLLKEGKGGEGSMKLTFLIVLSKYKDHFLFSLENIFLLITVIKCLYYLWIDPNTT